MGDSPGKVDPPFWVAIHLMAKDYGIPPWQVEYECPAVWFKQWSEYRMAEGAEMKRREADMKNAKPPQRRK